MKDTKTIEESFAEDAHAIKFFASVGDQYTIIEEYDIPESYYIDTFVLMPVQQTSLFTYWELTEHLLHSKLNDSSLSEFTIKLFDIKLGSKVKEREVFSLGVHDKVGSRYIDYSPSFKPLYAAVGVIRNGSFIELLRSKTVSVPSFEILGPDDSLWTKRLKEQPHEADALKKISKPGSSKEIEVLKEVLKVRSKDTDILKALMDILDKLKVVSGEKAKLLELLKGFIDVRVKDLELLRLFLEFIDQLNLLEGTGVDLSHYFEEIASKSTPVSSGELFQKGTEEK